MRLSTVLAATTLAALTLSACGGEPSPRAVTDAMEEIAAASSHDIVAIEIGGWEGSDHVGATVFHRNAERGYTFKDARETRISASSSTMPLTDLGDGPHVSMTWQDGSGADEQATVIVNIGTGDVMWSQIIRDGELVEEPEG